MIPQDKRTARARGYALLAELLLRGPGWADAAALTVFAHTPPDAEELAAEFVAAFDLGVPPYASVLLEQDGCVGGEVTRNILDAIAVDGYTPVTQSVAACHLGVLLGHAARLCRAGRDDRAAQFVQVHVLGWLPSYLAALESVAVPFWASVVSVALDLAADHVGACDVALLRGLPLPPREREPLGEDTGLRDVAVYLAYPARCGLHITDADCTRVGRLLDLPRGFGTRRDRLETLLRSAAEYGAMIPLCKALETLADERQRRVRSLSRRHIASPQFSTWDERIQTTRRMLKTLEAGAQTVENQERVAR